jgi:hypothetical protein
MCRDTIQQRQKPVFLLTVTILLFLAFGSCRISERKVLPSQDEIQRRVSAVLELPTYEYIYRDIVYIAEQASFLGIRHRDTQLLFAVDVRLQAGIDLRKGFSVRPITARPLSAPRVEVRLPEPEVLLIDADESSIQQYFKREFGGEINRLDYYDEISRSKEKIREDAVERGVLEQARKNAVSLIESVLGHAGFEEIDIRFADGGSAGVSP